MEYKKIINLLNNAQNEPSKLNIDTKIKTSI